MKKYRCKLCGYIYESEELPINYVCPICGVDFSHFEEYEEVEETDKRVKISPNNPSINRIMDKCINCGQCKNICENVVGIKYDIKVTQEPICINCGQCILGCPAGALVPKYNYKEVDSLINDNDKVVVAFTSPAVRVALGEEFGLPFGSFVEGQMVESLRHLGFDYVFDTTFGADTTIMEEVSELLERVKNNGVLPMFTSCCPSWVKYAEMFYPSILPNISSAKSPISMESALIKNYFSRVKNIEKENIVTVAITPCVAKKMEASREELKDTDYVITTSELGIYLREKNIDFKSLKSSDFDELMGKGTGSGVIFGNSGGVMEAALRTLNFLLTGENLKNDKLTIMDLRSQNEFKEASIEINGKVFNVAVIYGMPAVSKFLENMKNNDKIYHFVELMNCPGGCIGGGGQPLKAIGKLDEAREERIKSLYKNDSESKVRFSHENIEVKKIYNEFLDRPLSEKSKKLLHTNYEDKSMY